jgi:excisionase family DNA binding protein
VTAPKLSLDPPLLTARQAAELLGAIPPKTVLQLAREGRLPSVRIGRHVRFVQAELEATLTEHRNV